MVERKGIRKEQWDNMTSLPYNIRAQYIIDRYLKKLRLPKYQKMGTPEEDLEDFREIVKLKYFTIGDLAKYYTIIKGKIPPSLNNDMEMILYEKSSVKPDVKKDSSATVSKKQPKIGKKLKSSKKAKSSNFVEANDDEETVKVKTSILDKIKKDLKKRKEEIIKDSNKEVFDGKTYTKSIYSREKEAKNYNNEKYQKDKKKREELVKKFENISIGDSLDKEIKKLTKKIGKLPLGSSKAEPLGKRLRDIAKQEESKRRKTIFMKDIPSTKKKSSSPVSSKSSTISLESSSSEKSSGDWADYFD